MKKMILSILMLALLCVCLSAQAEGSGTVTLELNTAWLPIYDAGDPYTAMFGTGAEEDALPVLLLQVRQCRYLQVTVKPWTVKNKKVTLSVDDEQTVQVRSNGVTGLKPGEAILTIASEQDPSAALRYRVIVYRPVSRISLTASAKSVAAGGTLSLSPSVTPEDATVKEVTWSSSDERIARVDDQGTVTGVKRGYVRITAQAKDGSNIRASAYVQVTQNAEEITLEPAEASVDAGKAVILRATVLPRDTSDKTLIWSSSDESIATVSPQGRVTGVGRGDCEIVCTSRATGDVKAKATVHVRQLVKNIRFGEAPVVYANETGKLTWEIEPANANNPEITLKSGNEKVLKVSSDGTITGAAAGTTVVYAAATDGSYRRAQIRVKVLQHVEGVHMRRKTAYIDIGEAATAGAVLEPETATNHNMTWESADPSVATVQEIKGYPDRVRITGVGPGETTVTGTTEDGGYQASIRVKTGDWSHAAKIRSASISGKGKLLIQVKNVSELTLSNIKLEIEAYDSKGKPVPINKKNGSNVVRAVYGKRLGSGSTTPEDKWKLQDYDDEQGFQQMTVRIVEYQINGDWVKTLRKSLRPKYEYKPGK